MNDDDALRQPAVQELADQEAAMLLDVLDARVREHQQIAADEIAAFARGIDAKLRKAGLSSDSEYGRRLWRDFEKLKLACDETHRQMALAAERARRSHSDSPTEKHSG
ncbi:hypothetical protein [Mycobacteroides abscessus]|uniref:hypothetical protein n=1 Tax=Mycobacteroides abscessus TaxID=36809 RepID=UPI001F1BCD65|nr:hypothetical protein [Mycobacteroides abscessus]